ncbi:hypothetical protein [Croceimicrobium sp.]|uniref:hypothetical protein n=1 Tax=Croceimicrobium sp. TaxID=2828340 RepID=UPI003BA9A3F8
MMHYRSFSFVLLEFVLKSIVLLLIGMILFLIWDSFTIDTVYFYVPLTVLFSVFMWQLVYKWYNPILVYKDGHLVHSNGLYSTVIGSKVKVRVKGKFGFGAVVRLFGEKGAVTVWMGFNRLNEVRGFSNFT